MDDNETATEADEHETIKNLRVTKAAASWVAVNRTVKTYAATSATSKLVGVVVADYAKKRKNYFREKTRKISFIVYL